MHRGELTVTFIEALKAPLPHPWEPAGASEARMTWTALDTGSPPHPDHPIYLVGLGTTGDDDALTVLNLAAFSRIRVGGDTDTALALMQRWILELLTTHPATTIAASTDVWPGPSTTRIQPVSAGHVPRVDVLILGPDLTYAERAQILTAATSPILLDLGQDAAVNTAWTLICGTDRVGQISKGGSSRPVTVTLLIPSTDTLRACTDMLITPPPGSALPPAAPTPSLAPTTDTGNQDPPVANADTAPTLSGASIDFFAPTPGGPDAGVKADLPTHPHSDIGETRDAPAHFTAPQDPDGSQPGGAGDRPCEQTPPSEDLEHVAPAPQRSAPTTHHLSPRPGSIDNAAPAADDAGCEPVQIALIWNRILGQVQLCPPHSDQEPGNREKRLNELTVLLQHHRWVTTDEIITRIYNTAAIDKTVTQQMSLLRKRLAVVRPGGPKALPPMNDGQYHLDGAVRSDWLEFERLVEILIETTPTARLIAAMDLVTGPPLGGVAGKEWAWAKDLREELRYRVAGAAVVLAQRHCDAAQFGLAAEAARKGLWYDTARQDLWQVALQACLDGHDKDSFLALRRQYLSEIPGPERDRRVLDLTGQPG